MEASTTAVAQGETSAKLIAVQDELTAVKEKAVSEVTWGGRQCTSLQASTSDGAHRTGMVTSGRYWLPAPEESNLQRMADMKQTLEQQIGLLKDQLGNVCRNNACGSADEVMELLRQYRLTKEKHSATCAQLSLQHSRVEKMEFECQQAQKNFLELNEKLMQIYKALDAERRRGCLDVLQQQDSRIRLAPEYVESLAHKAQAEAYSAELSRCLGESWRHCSDLECQVAVLKHEHAWCRVDNAFTRAQMKELRLHLLSLNERLHEREAQLVSAHEELQLKEQSLNMANDDVHRCTEQSELYKKEICRLKQRVEELEDGETERFQMHARVQEQGVAMMQESPQTHQVRTA
ncbi:unnamed protein product [Ostreobium quekettii]|uniref:Uncharacterized protein n=1 Tax=Ostreobium quekettii TaxID=121088 RepID=A0A8S1JEC4_9CHLO|nr:unnamed protein product [Ostreobium quekettii]